MKQILTQKIELLVKTHEVALCRYCYGILRDREQAKDIVQDSFIKLIKQLNNEQVIENEKAWLYRVCHNLSLDYLRKMKIKNKNLEKIQQLTENQSITINPDCALSAKETQKFMWESLQNLSEREQIIIQLKIKNNYSYQQIADELKLTSTNVGFILHQAFKKLSVIFKQKEKNEVSP